MPPEPSSERVSYAPSRVPAARAMKRFVTLVALIIVRGRRHGKARWCYTVDKIRCDQSPGAISRISVLSFGIAPVLVDFCRGDDDLPLDLVLNHVPESLPSLTQMVSAVDDGRDLAGFEEIPQDGHCLLLGGHRNAGASQLFYEACEEDQLEEVGDEADHTLALRSETLVPDQYVSPVRFERAAASGEWAISRNVEDEIVGRGQSPRQLLLPSVPGLRRQTIRRHYTVASTWVMAALNFRHASASASSCARPFRVSS